MASEPDDFDSDDFESPDDEKARGGFADYYQMKVRELGVPYITAVLDAYIIGNTVTGKLEGARHEHGKRRVCEAQQPVRALDLGALAGGREMPRQLQPGPVYVNWWVEDERRGRYAVAHDRADR